MYRNLDTTMALKSISEGHTRIYGICDEPFKESDVLHSLVSNHGTIEGIQGKTTHSNYYHSLEISLVQLVCNQGEFQHFYPAYTRNSRNIPHDPKQAWNNDKQVVGETHSSAGSSCPAG